MALWKKKSPSARVTGTEEPKGVRRVTRIKKNPSLKQEPAPTPHPARKLKLPKMNFERVGKLLRSRRFHWGVIGTLFVVLLGFGALLAFNYLFNSPHFSIRKLEISPTTHVEREDLIAITRLKPGTNIFRLSPGHIAKKLVAHPWIRSARVSRVLPDTLRIRVTEQEAKAAVLFTGGETPHCTPGSGECDQTPFYLVNNAGEVFKRALPSELEGQVIITGILRSTYLKDPHGTQRKLARALSMAQVYAQNPARPEISEIFLEGDIVTLFMKKTGTAVHLDIQRFSSLMATFDSFLGGIDFDLGKYSEVYMDNRESPDRIVCIPHKIPEDAKKEEEKALEKGAPSKKNGLRLSASNRRARKATNSAKLTVNKRHSIAARATPGHRRRAALRLTKKSKKLVSSNR